MAAAILQSASMAAAVLQSAFAVNIDWSKAKACG